MVPPIIHRDLKPANILISRNNGQDSFWVTDFGIGALAAENALGGHRQGMSRGDLMSQSLRGTHTPVYASPEQVNHAVADPRDDVHALAVIAYQLLVGDSTEKPGSDLEDVLKDLGINGSLIQILKDALRTKREQRLLIAGLFAKRLEGLSVVSMQKLEAEKIAAAKAENAWQAAKLEKERLAAATAENARKAAKSMEEQREVLKVIDLKPPGNKRKGNCLSTIFVLVLIMFLIFVSIFSLLPDIPRPPSPSQLPDMQKPYLPTKLAPTSLKTRTIDLGEGVKLEMALIPTGKFLMGSPSTEKGSNRSETQHEVTISNDFYIGRTEVTQAQWVSVMGKNPSFFKGDELPVEQISWDDAIKFCNRLSEMPEEKKAGGRNYRLPTESEWEYACRAGTITPFHFGSELDGRQANCDGTVPYGTATEGPYLEKTTPVGKYPANAWGLYDMHGNVSEWCADLYGDYPSGSVTDPSGRANGSDRVYRGGCWSFGAVNCRSANRFGFGPSYRNGNLGFRVAMSSSEISK